MILADLHVHSTYSDGRMTIPELIDFYGRLEFGCIAITDHICENSGPFGIAARLLAKTLTPDRFAQYIDEIEAEAHRAMDQYKMVVIPGFEISKNSIRNSRSAHLLGLGIREWVSADTDIADAARAIRNGGGSVVAAHPVWTRRLEKQTFHIWNRKEELEPLIDAWEIASGPVLFDEVAQSGLPIVASSDLHVPEQITAWKTVLHCERSEQACLTAIKRQRLAIKFYSPFEHAMRAARPNTMLLQNKLQLA